MDESWLLGIDFDAEVFSNGMEMFIIPFIPDLRRFYLSDLMA
jgi:hypothetical protein